MKTKVLLILMLAANICFAQSKNEPQKENNQKNELRVYYAFADNDLLRNADLDGAGGSENGNSFHMGVLFLRKISRKLFFETGVTFFKTTVETSFPKVGPRPPHPNVTENLELITIPAYLNYPIGKHFFINGGIFVAAQFGGEKYFDSQSGIGYNIGVGVKFNHKNFTFYANPFFKRHAWIPFNSDGRYPEKLTEGGIQIGVGYRF